MEIEKIEKVTTNKGKTKDAEDVNLQICWILDITGSMSSQIQACKSAIAECSSKISAEQLPVSFTLITYTEETSKSYATYHSFTEGDDMVNFINKLVCCQPPGHPGVSCSGGDGDENVKLALAKFHKEHNFEIPTVCFFLTDAPYHKLSGTKSQEAIAEERELKSMNYPIDIFEIWHKIPLEQIFFFPFSPIEQTYSQFAKQTNGVQLTLNSNSTIMSNAMVNIVKNILDLLTGETDEVIKKIEGFQVYDIENIIIRTKETENQGNSAIAAKNEEDTERILSTALKKIIQVVGKGWNKRKINVNGLALHYQMKLVAYCMKYFVLDQDKENEKEDYNLVKTEIEFCLKKIDEYLPEEQKNYVNINLEKIENIKKEILNKKCEEESMDLLTLLSVKEIAEDTKLNDIKNDFISTVCSAIYGLPINIVFQTDALGKPDFTSAWDGVIPKIGIDLQSMKTFLQLVEKYGGFKQVGLTDKIDYNSFVALSGFKGTVRWGIFKVASSTQVLDSAMSLCVGAKITESIPNLHAGILSTVMMKLIQLGYNKSLYSRMIDVLNTINGLGKIPAKSLQEEFKKGNVNPEDAIGKMILVWYRVARNNKELLNKILREFIGMKVLKYFGKNTPENNEKYNSYLNDLFAYNSFFEEFDKDVFKFHTLEKSYIIPRNLETIYHNEFKGENFSQADSNLIQIAKTNFKELDEAKLKELYSITGKMKEILFNKAIKEKIIKENKLFISFIEEASRLITYLSTDITKEEDEEPKLIDVLSVYPESIDHYIEALILRKRSERYNSFENLESKGVYHLLKDIPVCIESLLLEKIIEFNSSLIQTRKQERICQIKKILISKVIEELKKNQGKNREEWVEFLSKNNQEIDGKVYKLERSDLVIIDEIYFPGNSELVWSIIIGKWTPLIPQTISRQYCLIKPKIDLLNNEELALEIKQEINKKSFALRKTPNRHGYSNEFQFPGAYNYSVNFEEKCKNKKLTQNVLLFTEIYNKFMMDTRLNKNIISEIADAYFYSPDQHALFETLVQLCHPNVFNSVSFERKNKKKAYYSLKKRYFDKVIK